MNQWIQIVLILALASSHRLIAFVSPRQGASRVTALQSGVSYNATSPTITESSSHTSIKSLYPPIDHYSNGTLLVDDTHSLFFQEYGNPDGLPALFLHGGPGAGCFPNHARFFDANRYRIVLLDQRGCGKSTPRGEWKVNQTLLQLIKDCEALRRHLDIEQWKVVLGGSWGTTLALAYAQEYPTSVASLVLRGVCLMRPSEIDWLFGGDGVARLDPDGWKDFCNTFNTTSSNDYRAALHAHYNRLLGDDPVARIEAARSWMTWEMRASSLNRTNMSSTALVLVGGAKEWSYQHIDGGDWQYSSDGLARKKLESLKRGLKSDAPLASHQTTPRPVQNASCSHNATFNLTRKDASKFIPAQAMLTCFYSVNEQYAMNNLNLLDPERIQPLRKNVRCIAIHGGLDSICPVDTALDLKEVWPEMELRIPIQAGHSMYDPANAHQLMRATDELADYWMQQQNE